MEACVTCSWGLCSYEAVHPCLQQGPCSTRLQEWSGQTAKSTNRRYFAVSLGLTGQIKQSSMGDLNKTRRRHFGGAKREWSLWEQACRLQTGSGQEMNAHPKPRSRPLPPVGHSTYFRGDTVHIGLQLWETGLHLIHV